MFRWTVKRVSLWLALTLCPILVVPSASAQKGGRPRVAAKKQKPSAAQPQAAQNSPIPAYQPAPLTPVPLDQVPAVAPKVAYKDGELTIEAHNSTLADVLKAVRQQTGAELEIPPNATERVVADLGPGPARQVLADLLNGTHFNYVMVGSSTDPSAVQSIFLTSKSGSAGAESASGGVGRSPFPQPSPAATISEPEPPAEDTADGAEAVEDNASDQAADQQNQQTPGQQAPKTPEQLLQELQRQQQQQNGQTPQTGQPPQTILPNQPPTTTPPNQHRPD